jgi:hypothetical protein
VLDFCDCGNEPLGSIKANSFFTLERSCTVVLVSQHLNLISLQFCSSPFSSYSEFLSVVNLLVASGDTQETLCLRKTWRR